MSIVGEPVRRQRPARFRPIGHEEVRELRRLRPQHVVVGAVLGLMRVVSGFSIRQPDDPRDALSSCLDHDLVDRRADTHGAVRHVVVPRSDDQRPIELPARAANTSKALSGAGADPIRQPVVISRRHPAASKMNGYREPRTVRAPEPYERAIPDSTESPISNAATGAASSDANNEDQPWNLRRSAERCCPGGVPPCPGGVPPTRRSRRRRPPCPGGVPWRSPVKRTRATAPRRGRSARRA